MTSPLTTGTVRPWAPQLQRERTARLHALLREAARSYFDADGNCLVLDSGNFSVREVVHYVLAMMAGDPADVALANRILAKAQLTGCHFTALALIQLLLRHPDRVTAENRERILRHLPPVIEETKKPYNTFSGANDNFPAMGCFIQVVGGEVTGNDHAVQAGLDGLYVLRDLLCRRGFFSEYNSPTYAAVTLQALDETGNYAQHPEARELAQLGAERMWLDIAAHWHPGLSFPAGPYSRAYHENSLAWGSSAVLVPMWVAFGDDVVFNNPVVSLFSGLTDTIETRSHSLPFSQAECAGYGGAVYRIPDYIGELVLEKSYPFRIRATSESCTFHTGDYRLSPEGAFKHVPGASSDYGANSVDTCTYMEEDFALGTASRPFCGGGQNEIFHVLYQQHAPASSWADIRAIFARYLVNDTAPEDHWNGHHCLAQQAYGVTVQDDRRALALYHPNGYLHQDITSLKLSLLLQEMTSPIEEIWIGDRLLPDGNGESAEADWVILRDGRMLLAFYPLATTDLGRTAVIRSEQVNGYRLLSFYNYEGPTRDFSMHDVQIAQNGFVFEAAPLAEYGDARAFLADLRKAEIIDGTVLEDRRTRYYRDGRELFLWMHPALTTVKAAVVNGKAVDCPVLEIDGVDNARVPWLNQPGILYNDLSWWKRILDRPGVAGLENLSGRNVTDLP